MKKLLLAVFIISLITRIIYLGIIIPSVSNDEADLYLSSYLLAKSGTDYYNNQFFLTSGILTAKPSIPIYIGSLSWSMNLEKNVYAARFLFLLINSITPVLFFLTILYITKNSKYAFLSFLVLNFSPWFSYMSVTGYESLVCFAFINASLLISVAPIKKSTKLVVLAIFSFLIFNSYMAIRTYMPFIILINLLLGDFIDKKQLVKSIFYLFIVGIAFTGLLTVMNYYAPNSSLVRNEFKYMVDVDKASNEGKVWYERLTTDAPELGKKLLVNKFTIQMNEYAKKYLSLLDMNIFFFKGDPSSLYGTAGLIGLFYLTDFFFFIFGLVNLKSLDKKLLYLICFMAVGGIPIALTKTDVTVILRGIILLVPFTIIISHGIASFIKRSKAYYPLYLLILFLNWIFFMTIYNARIKPLNRSAWQMNQKMLIEKVDSLNRNYKITVFESDPRAAFIQYSFYKIKDPSIIKERLRNRNYEYGQIEYKETCPKELQKGKMIYIMKHNYCEEFYRKYSANTAKITDNAIKINQNYIVNSDFSGDNYILIMSN